jgi:ATP-dependent Clp protease adapter protein ClpS
MSLKSLDHPEADIETVPKEELGNPWQVVLFNDEVHSIDEVVFQIQKATGFALERAFELTMRVHNNGKAVIYIGTEEKCERVAGVLALIRLIVQVEKT